MITTTTTRSSIDSWINDPGTLVSLRGLPGWCEGLEKGSWWILLSLPLTSRGPALESQSGRPASGGSGLRSHGSSEALRLRLLCPGASTSSLPCLLELARELGTVRILPLRDLGRGWSVPHCQQAVYVLPRRTRAQRGQAVDRPEKQTVVRGSENI